MLLVTTVTASPVGCLGTARSAQGREGVLPVCVVTAADPGAAQAHVYGLAAGVHAADRGVAQAARPAVAPEGALPAGARGAHAHGGAPRQAVVWPCGRVHLLFWDNSRIYAILRRVTQFAAKFWW